MKERIIQIGSLQEFTTEVPPAVVRLQDQYTVRGGCFPSKLLRLNLFGLGQTAELIWLSDSFELSLTPGTDEPWTDQGKAVMAAFPRLKDLVAEYLTSRGYTVRPGRYATPANVTPMDGVFECACWDPAAQTFVGVPDECAH